MNNKTLPKVAVLLAAYNGQLWIREQIATIQEQVDVEVDIYISLDLSKDDSFSLCQELSCNNSNVFLLPYGQRFGGAGKNFFRLISDVNFTVYDYIALSDQDDVWFKEKLSRATSIICSKNVDAYSSDVLAFWPDGRKCYVKKSYSQKKNDYWFEAAGPGCTYVLTADSAQELKSFVIENINRLNNKVELHDWFIYAFYRCNKYDWYIDAWPSLLYRQHAENQVGVNIGLGAMRRRLSLVRSKWYRGQVESLLAILSTNSEQLLSLNRLSLMLACGSLRRRPRDVVFIFFAILFKIF